MQNRFKYTKIWYNEGKVAIVKYLLVSIIEQQCMMSEIQVQKKGKSLGRLLVLALLELYQQD